MFLQDLGAIGGADGPTAVFITGPRYGVLTVLLVAAAAAGVFWLIRRRKK